VSATVAMPLSLRSRSPEAAGRLVGPDRGPGGNGGELGASGPGVGAVSGRRAQGNLDLADAVGAEVDPCDWTGGAASAALIPPPSASILTASAIRTARIGGSWSESRVLEMITARGIRRGTTRSRRALGRVHPVTGVAVTSALNRARSRLVVRRERGERDDRLCAERASRATATAGSSRVGASDRLRS
jgi:hypothetical protein